MDAITRQRIVSRFLRLGVSGGARSSSDDQTVVEALETELALLREENATLKVDGHRPADTGRIIDGMRELRESAQNTEVLVEAATRDGLLDACREIQQAMQGMRRRLNELPLDGDRGLTDPAVDGQAASRFTGDFELELAVAGAAPAESRRAA
jgi:hypothetical protein